MIITDITGIGDPRILLHNGTYYCYATGHDALFYGKDGALYTSFHIQTDPAHPSGDRRLVIGRVELAERDGMLTERIF